MQRAWHLESARTFLKYFFIFVSKQFSTSVRFWRKTGLHIGWNRCWPGLKDFDSVCFGLQNVGGILIWIGGFSQVPLYKGLSSVCWVRHLRLHVSRYEPFKTIDDILTFRRWPALDSSLLLMEEANAAFKSRKMCLTEFFDMQGSNHWPLRENASPVS